MTTSDDAIPPFAAHWINTILDRPHDRQLSEKLKILKAKELHAVLKKIWDDCSADVQSSYPPFPARHQWKRLLTLKRSSKSELCDAVRMAFYKDETCTVCVDAEDEVWKRLGLEDACSGCRGLAVPPGSNGMPHAATAIPCGDSGLPASGPFPLMARSASQTNGNSGLFMSTSASQTNIHKRLKTTHPFSSHKNPVAKKTDPPRRPPPPKMIMKIKLENPDTTGLTTPRTHRESVLLSQMRQIGFTDDEESLGGIRHVGPLPDIEEWRESTIMFVITQREEASEARKTDLARQFSEQYREMELRQNKERESDGLVEMSVERIVGEDFFGDSIVLRGAEDLKGWNGLEKREVLELLHLEKKALKWYGRATPLAYFIALKSRIKSSKDNCLSLFIKELKNALYSLEEQDGGVPRVFLQAEKEQREERRPKEGADDNDDEVEVLLLDRCHEGKKIGFNLLFIIVFVYCNRKMK